MLEDVRGIIAEQLGTDLTKVSSPLWSLASACPDASLPCASDGSQQLFAFSLPCVSITSAAGVAND